MLSQQQMYQTGSGAALTETRPDIFLTTMQHCPDVVYNIYQKVFLKALQRCCPNMDVSDRQYGAALTDARPNIFLTTMQHCPDVVYNIYQKVFSKVL